VGVFFICQNEDKCHFVNSTKLGRISFSQGGAFMPKDRQKSQKTVSTKEYKIGGTRYVVTAHFKSQGSTAIDHIKRMIDNATQNNICRKY